MTYDIIIVGCGFSGAVIAHKMAVEKGKRVLILDKRDHIAGNMYDKINDHGVLIHQYGPHIFHTNSDEVYRFLSRFTEWNEYHHRVLGSVGGQLVPIPFNFKSLEALYPAQSIAPLKDKIAQSFAGKNRVSVLELLDSPDEEINAFGQFVYENVFANYTAKQWGVPPEQVDRSVINRVPVVLGFEDTYFSDKYQRMPKHGYTALFKKMLDHPNITLELGVDGMKRLELSEEGGLKYNGEEISCPVVFTGPIDELCGFRFGELPYRSLKMDFENHFMERYQPAAVVNYPNDQLFTRITEYKHMTGQELPGRTTIMKEYPMKYDRFAPMGNIPYYPINNDETNSLYNRYTQYLAQYKNVYLCGRLADYRYYNMDGAVERAFGVYEKIAEEF